jgi:CheY-like chemotaxis protein
MALLRDIPLETSHTYVPGALRILVVEDNFVIAMLLEATLTGMGYSVCAVEATEQGAVTAAARCQPDLLIVDSRLREGNGVSAVERILQTGFVPHVFVSGVDLRAERLDARAVTLHKPYNEPELFAAIQRALAPPLDRSAPAANE